MSFEKINLDRLGSFDRQEENPEEAMLTKEKENKLKAELEEARLRFKEAVYDFNLLSEDDYFESRQKLEKVRDRINDAKIEQKIILSKLNELINFKTEFSSESLQSEVDNNPILKN